MSWIVCVRDVSSGNDTYIGPYRSNDTARGVAERLLMNIKACGATDEFDAIVEEIRNGGDYPAFRDELIDQMASRGYMKGA